MQKINVVAGLDIGNGYVKAAVSEIEKLDQDSAKVDFASGVARLIYPKDIKVEDDEQIRMVINDIFNHLDASFGSNAVRDTTRRLFGQRALTSGSSLEEFDTESVKSKAQQDLSGVLILGTLAAQALKFYFDKEQALPKETLKVDAHIALALPINEFMNYRKDYAAKFLNGNHRVTIHNFVDPIHVDIDFKDVQVLAEGASAQYAIIAKGKPLMDAMLSDVRQLGESLEGITSDDILAARNTIGIDIGEGTVNFPVFQDGRFNPDSSLTFDRGFSTVLNNALDHLGPAYHFRNRKQLADFLQQEPNNITRGKHERCRLELEKQIYGFAVEVAEQFSRVMSRAGASTEVIYIYGGGATDLKDPLHQMILDEVKGFGASGMEYPVLYLDSRYSRFLNREGLFIVARNLVQRDMKL